ncbi:MAG: N-formylglutamate amidohydrolase [Pseudomonadota bacterium]
MTEFPPIERIAASGESHDLSGLVLVCDHASNVVPPDVAPLGLPPEDMGRHIAFDVGAAGVTRGLAERLDCPAVLSTWSRLVIDPNRGADDPTLVMKLSDGAIISGNRDVGRDEIARRLETLYWPYHHAIDAELDIAGSAAVLVSVHSFTPQFRGRPTRPWHIGLLWDHDDRLVAPLLDELRAEGDLFVGDNEPYSGQLAGDCMWMHGTKRGIPHVLIEIRNDLIADKTGEDDWAERLAPILRRAIVRMRGTS